MRATATATKIPESAAHQEIALVTRVEGARAVVRADDVEYRAKRAASCLLEPQEGDRVLCAVALDGSAWVLAVLDREGGATAIAVDGDLELVSRTGRVRVAGAEGVSLASHADVTIAAGELELRAVATSLVTEGLELLGKAARVEVGQVKILAETLDAVLDRLSQRIKRAYRVVEERDHLRAGTIDYAAEKAISLSSENTIVLAKELVKVDGGQIQLG
jgi:hypothetical protein